MNSIYPMSGALVLMVLAYRFYARYLAVRVFQLDDSRPTPAVILEDGIDYVPTPKPVVFNHHFASIAGLSPILGPAVAVIWGWVPAMIWIVFGAILMGATHDIAALVLSIRNKGRSVGVVAHNLLGIRARILFLLIIFFAVALAMGAFTKVVALLLQKEATGFKTYPEAVFPAGMLMVIAMVCGVMMRRGILGLLPVSIIGTLLTFVCIWIGAFNPILISFQALIYILLVYVFAASVLPVWFLLQPRDFINAFTLYIGMILLYAAVFYFQPAIVAPAINPNPSLPNMIPLLFVVVACGAISGFHSVVASGTTGKQLAKESDARAVGYGAMLAESALGVIAVITCTAGLSSSQEWAAHYESWDKAGSLGAQLSVFVQGAANFISWLGVPLELAATFVSLVVVSFALTTLDTGTRILRYNVEEIGETFDDVTQGLRARMETTRQLFLSTVPYALWFVLWLGVPIYYGLFKMLWPGVIPCPWDIVLAVSIAFVIPFQIAFIIAFLVVFIIPVSIVLLKNRFFSTAAAIGAIWYLAVSNMGTQLWVLFGTTNQLLAGLVLLTATVYLIANRRPSWVTAIPMLVMLVITLWAMTMNLSDYIDRGNTNLIVVGGCILALAIGLIFEAVIFFSNRRSQVPPERTVA